MSTGGVRNDPATFVQRVLDAAQAHGEQSDHDHEVGDLQEVVRILWKLVPATKKYSAMADPNIRNLLESWIP